MQPSRPSSPLTKPIPTPPSIPYSSTFTLNKLYLIECYEESVVLDRAWRAYRKASVIISVALILLILVKIDTYIASFILILGLIDAASIYYHKAWWLARQTLSSSYNSVVKLSITEEGITTQSPQASNTVHWSDITQVQISNRGMVIHHTKGKNYLSKSTLEPSVSEYIQRHG